MLMMLVMGLLMDVIAGHCLSWGLMQLTTACRECRGADDTDSQSMAASHGICKASGETELYKFLGTGLLRSNEWSCQPQRGRAGRMVSLRESHHEDQLHWLTGEVA